LVAAYYFEATVYIVGPRKVLEFWRSNNFQSDIFSRPTISTEYGIYLFIQKSYTEYRRQKKTDKKRRFYTRIWRNSSTAAWQGDWDSGPHRRNLPALPSRYWCQ